MADDLIEVRAGLALRPAAEDDRDFLLRVYGSTRVDELNLVPWTEDEKTAFVLMQFEAQDTSYRQTYPAGAFLVVLADGEPVGRLYHARTADELRIIDITLLPERRGNGIGSALLIWLLEGADAEGLGSSLHVEPWNPATRLYERLGFELVEQGPVYQHMRRRAAVS